MRIIIGGPAIINHTKITSTTGNLDEQHCAFLKPRNCNLLTTTTTTTRSAYLFLLVLLLLSDCSSAWIPLKLPQRSLNSLYSPHHHAANMGGVASKHPQQSQSTTSPPVSSSTARNSNSVRDSLRENINTDNHEPHNDASIIDRNRHNHSQAETVDTASTEDWSQVTDRFKSQCLDESFVVYPIRGSTIEAADQYPKSSLDHAEDERGYLMPGTHKHLGGAYDPTDGCIYGVPANSRAVLCLYPKTNGNQDGAELEYLIKAIPLPKDIQEVRMKWLRGIFAHGYLWAIPSWAPKVLCVDIDAYWGRREAQGDIVQLLDLPEEHPKNQIWQWHGAGINHEKTAIYCIPSNAHQVLKVDLATKTTSLIPVDIDPVKYPDLDVTKLTNKW